MARPRSWQFWRVAPLLLIAALFVLSPQVLQRGPDLCLWRHLFGLASCPACGSTRALAAFFHGHFAQALAFNRNVLVTAPLLLTLAVRDLGRWFREIGRQSPRT